MLRLIAFASLSLSACSLAVPIRIASEYPPEETDALLLEASDILDLPLVSTDSSRGAITLDIHKSAGAFSGRNLVRRGCYRASWAAPNAETIAHEIAHALGLDHVDPAQTDNLMTPSGTGVALTHDQHADLERGARSLQRCL